jgi:hypothetical protein
VRKNQIMDELSSIASRGLDFLFLKNPTRTSIGILIGIMISGFSPAFNPVLLKLTNVDFSVVHTEAWLALGILMSSLRGSPVKEKLPEDIELVFDLLKKAERAGISKEELKNKYRIVAIKYIQNIGLNEESKKELDEIRSGLK